MSEALHIAYCTDEAYAPFVAASLRSLAQHHRPSDVVIHLVHDGLSPEALRTIEKCGFDVNLHLIPPNYFGVAGAPAAALARLALPELLSCDRVLYLDADTLILDSLLPLGRVDLGGRPVGAVRDVSMPWLAGPRTGMRGKLPLPPGVLPTTPYFNSGVLLIDLALWRDFQVTEQTRTLLAHDSSTFGFYEQDALNCAIAGNFHELHPRWNSFAVLDFTFLFEELIYDRNEFDESRLSPAIVHFASLKPSDPRVRECRHGGRWIELLRDAGWTPLKWKGEAIQRARLVHLHLARAYRAARFGNSRGRG